MGDPRSGRAHVSLQTRPMWRIRSAAGLTRYVLYAVALTGVGATVRYAVSPPASTRVEVRSAAAIDLSSAGYATLFARRYLTWEAGKPDRRERALAPFVGSGLDADAGLQPPAGVSQRVEWAEPAQVRVGPAGARVYTIATQTDRSGLLYLAVEIVRGADGRLRVAGYPALVGPPASAGADPAAGAALRDVADASLGPVIERALTNYLAGSASNLAADLTPDAHVAPPTEALSLGGLSSLQWLPDGRSVVAVVRVADASGGQYTLRYELDVARVGARWEIAAIEMDPTA